MGERRREKKYSVDEYTNTNVNAIIYVSKDEKITNNDGKDYYTFEENGTFTFKYLDINNKEKEVVAEVKNIDKTAPKISGIKDKTTYAKSVIPKVEDENLISITLIKDGTNFQG